MGSQAAREHIAFGPTESFAFPVPAGFVRQRQSILNGATATSKPIRIDHSSDFGLAVFVIFKDNGGGAVNYDLGYEILLSSDGIDGSNGEYKNAIWGPLVSIVAGATANTASYTIGATTFPATQAIRLTFTNNGAGATAVAPNPTIPGDLGRGLHVRVSERSKP